MARKNALGKGLGQGLDSLIPSTNTDTGAGSANTTPVYGDVKEGETVTMVKVISVEPNKDQPRKTFPEEALTELSESIKKNGVISPLIVVKTGDTYMIVAGERRWRAAKRAGLKEVPVIIKDYTKEEILEIALIENLQREDLNPVEEALAYRRLMTELGLKQEEVADRVSKSRTAVANSMRLLKLPEQVQEMLVEGTLSSGHARALLSLEDADTQCNLAKRVVSENLTVRDVEKLVKSMLNPPKPPKPKYTDDSLKNIYMDYSEKLKNRLGTKVNIKAAFDGTGSGKMEIDFYSHDDVERIFDILMRD